MVLTLRSEPVSLPGALTAEIFRQIYALPPRDLLDELRRRAALDAIQSSIIVNISLLMVPQQRCGSLPTMRSRGVP